MFKLSSSMFKLRCEWGDRNPWTQKPLRRRASTNKVWPKLSHAQEKLLQLTYPSAFTTSPSILSIEVSESQSRNQKRKEFSLQTLRRYNHRSSPALPHSQLWNILGPVDVFPSRLALSDWLFDFVVFSLLTAR